MILCDSDCFVRFTDVIFHVYSESSWPLYFVIPGDTSSIIVRITEFHGHDICSFAQCILLMISYRFASHFSNIIVARVCAVSICCPTKRFMEYNIKLCKIPTFSPRFLFIILMVNDGTTHYFFLRQ